MKEKREGRRENIAAFMVKGRAKVPAGCTFRHRLLLEWNTPVWTGVAWNWIGKVIRTYDVKHMQLDPIHPPWSAQEAHWMNGASPQYCHGLSCSQPQATMVSLRGYVRDT